MIKFALIFKDLLSFCTKISSLIAAKLTGKQSFQTGNVSSFRSTSVIIALTLSAPVNPFARP